MENVSGQEFSDSYARAFGEGQKAAAALEMLNAGMRQKGVFSDAYLRHNMAVALTMLRLGFERNAVLAGLLHNWIRIGLPLEAVAREFGRPVAELIEQQDRFERALENKEGGFEGAKKKLSIVLSTSPVVVVLQLSESLDKIRHLEDVPESEREGFVEEISQVYAPLAHKLGIYTISSEMNELAFRHEQPETYGKIQAMMAEIIGRAGSGMQQAREKLLSALGAAGIDAEMHDRTKTVYSTYQKMKRKGAGIGRIYDLQALRLVTSSEKECYEALGIAHTLWKPIPGEFDDYIAKPKPNGYRSLHTSVFTEQMVPLEIQIRTRDMHDFAEFGIASHWTYKGGKADSRYDRKIDWIKQLMEWEKSSGGKTEIDFFGKEVFALTPKGEVVELPFGSTVLDFAYSVHSDLGHRCRGAKVNGAMCALNTQIKNGDVVEIITNSKQSPKMGWLGFVKTAKARQKIRASLHMDSPDEGRKKNAGPQGGMATSDRRIRLAKCCLPLPGDEIIGFRTTKRKIAVHRASCAQAAKMPGRLDVYWGGGSGEYDAEIVVHATERNGMLKDILATFSKNMVQVKATNARSGAHSNIVCRFSIAVKNLGELDGLTKKIMAVKGVNEVYRE